MGALWYASQVPLDPNAPTLVGPAPAAAPETQLAPGATLAGRYRIVTQLGKGGMGEVYRADDLTLGVSVALKFLPASLAIDPVRLERFKSEVRVARQISHPNICRVFDLVESAPETRGRPFITMEYVDGEDLASLLRRIGRLPHDKAVQIARQLCFGLAAAHEQGIIHRDLKPANIMLDGRGNARIMDFGIAVPASGPSVAGSGVASIPHFRAGTPGYMAPEQFAGLELTPRSDLYSLGLVLYELFTGRPAFDEAAVAELSRGPTKTGTRASAITSPSHFLPDLDPAVERIILRCLEPDPDSRPPSAIAVAAALPGGDPLAAAIAAGETPSPELVAGSGSADTMSLAQAWGRAGICAALIVAFLVLTSTWSMIARVKPQKRPDVLQDRATDLIRAVGYTDPPADSISGLSSRDAFIQRTNVDKGIVDKAAALAVRPGTYEFWYRQSPTPIMASDKSGIIGQVAPFPSIAGEVLFRSDTAGRLEFLAVVPPRKRSETPAELPESTVKRLFDAADLDPSRFTAAEPVFRPFVAADSIRSWTGTIQDLPDLPIRVHLAAADGKPVYFAVSYPWSVAAMQSKPASPPPRTTPLEYAAGVVVALVIIGTLRLVYVNLRTSRGDRTSAFRVAVVMFFFAALNIGLALHRIPTPREVLLDGGGFALAAFAAIEFWFFYIAVEPYARRVYPQSLVSWTRLLRGSFNDPLVGRHVLIGVTIGCVSVFCTGLFAFGLRTFLWQNHAIAFYGRTGVYLGGPLYVASMTADVFVTALMLGAGTMLPLVTGQLVFKRRWAGYVVLAVALAALEIGQITSNPIEGAAGIVIAMIPILAISRGGLLALVATHVTIYLGQMLPVGLDWSHWFAAPAVIPAAVLALIAVLAARAASAGRSFSLDT